MKAADILRMIEAVSPDDAGKLDEIEARIWCWLNNRVFHGRDGKGRFAYNLHYPLSMPHPRKRIDSSMQYTRSRDALKEIRPEGHYIDLHAFEEKWLCRFTNHEGKILIESEFLPTEELAELHAIIQAIEHERGGK